MKKKIINVIKFLVFLGIGVFLFWYIYKDEDFNVLLSELKKVNYFWIALSLVIGLLSHVSRAIRWKMLGESLGYKPSGLNSFFAVMIAYLANLAVPRLGEASRAVVLKRYEKIPFSEGFGTIVIERIVDLIMLFILTIIVLLSQFKVVREFITNNPSVGDKFRNFSISNTTLIIIGASIIGLIILFFLLKRWLKNTKLYEKIISFKKEFVGGIKSIRKVKSIPMFIFHSVFIWFMYFLMLYVSYFAFESTSHLTLLTALTVFVFGAFGMVAPVQGGIGAYHFMLIGALVIYGVADADAKSFALIVHGVQTLMLVVVGILSLIALPLVNKK